ncbi:hypothetical protein GCM10023143_34120 [Compostibacter hankyongensis]|uniref:Blue (type 1) copper domain-containing protein n=2 Tax=Compostibacter hankyongensis TaxID=1007089 RepID=A0ABP8G9J7_9BACT
MLAVLLAASFLCGKAKAQEIQLKAVAGLHYDKVRFRVSPGTQIKLTLSNTDDMDHNLVITRPGARMKVVKAAEALGAKGPGISFIPTSQDVLWHIPTVRPGETLSVTFTAPRQPGVYPYVCTYPAHGATMYGAMYVTDKPLPALKDDPNIPRGEGGDMHSMHAAVDMPEHPYPMTPPYLYRTFMPDAGPAAIAVHLPHDLSYCWDAGSCSLRYVWSGGFLEHEALWKGKGDAVAGVAGDIFFRAGSSFQFRIGDKDSIPGISFKGYRLVSRYPEFHYRLNNLEIYELITLLKDGSGLRCSFRITGATDTLWLPLPHTGTATVSCSAGQEKNGLLRLLPAEAARFTLTIKKEGHKP